jgi:uncharacterized protein
MRTSKAAVLAFFLVFSASAASAASFDCYRARTPDEHAICNDRALNDKDVELTTRYSMVLQLLAMGMRGDLQDEQRAWLARRRTCGASRACIGRLYDQRISRIKGVFDGVASHGPF